MIEPPQATRPGPTALQWRLPAALALVHLVACLLVFQPDPHTGGDNATYLSLAWSLLEGRYVDLWAPGQPPHGQYPPGFPALLALAWSLGLKGLTSLKLVSVAASAAAVGLTTAWAVARFGPAVALLTGLSLALMPGALEHSHWVLSDVPFWTFVALALLALDRLAPTPSPPPARLSPSTPSPSPAPAPARLSLSAPARRSPARRSYIALTAIALLAAYLTRSAALPLVLAATLSLSLRRDWRVLAGALALVAPAAVAWHVYAASVGGGYGPALLAVDPYQPQLGTIGPTDLLDRIGTNLTRYAGALLPRVLLGSTGTAAIVGTAVLAVLAGVGWARSLRRPGVAALFLPLYVGLLLVWPATWAGERFLLPLVGLVLAFAFDTALRGLSALRLPPRATTAALAATLVVALAVPLKARAERGFECRAAVSAGQPYPCTDPVWRDFYLLAGDLRGRLPEGAVVLSRKPSLFYVLSGYTSGLYALSPDPEVFFAEADRAGAGWVVVDQSPDLGHLYLHPVLLAARDDFCVVPDPRRPAAVLARIERGGAPRPPGAPAAQFRSCPLGPDDDGG